MDIKILNSELQNKIKKILQNEKFRNLCLRERNREDFDNILTNSLKIAGIDVSNIHENKSLISNTPLFSQEQIKNDVFDFYTALDSLDPNGINLVNKINENLKYVRLKPKTLGERSYCGSSVDEKGNKHREIFINIEGRIGDAGTAIHELCHSCCTQFTECLRSKDMSVSEIPTLIVDQLSSRFLMKKHPQFAENFLENEKFEQKQNVKKARECVFDALLIKIICGEMTFEKVIQNYGDMFSEFPDILPDKLKEIEKNEYKPFYEYTYLIPQAIALEMGEKFKKQPELAAKQLKEIIKDNHILTEEQILNYLVLPQKDQLIDDYVAKFQDRMKEINIEQQSLANNPVA